MLKTSITELLGIRHPIIAAPMAGVSCADLAIASSRAGSLGTIALASSTDLGWARSQINEIEKSGVSYGIGLMAWSLDARPELLDFAIQAKPKLISLSFGDLSNYVREVKKHGISVTTQIGTFEELEAAASAGVDFVVARGAEGGGHGLNEVATLVLLQQCLQTAEIPIVAGGGIVSASGLAAVLAAGASGVWIGTALMTANEALTAQAAKDKLLAAKSADTIYSRVFDIAQGIPWPARFGGRSLRNLFIDQWYNKEEDLLSQQEPKQLLAAAIKSRDYDIAQIYCGQGVGLVSSAAPAGDIISKMAAEAEILLTKAADLVTL